MLPSERKKCGPKKGYTQTQEHVLKKKRFGEAHGQWKGDAIVEKSGRTRALRMFPDRVPCCKCGNPKSERHHIDGNTANNTTSNISMLCRRCHMEADGRLAAFQANATNGGWKKRNAYSKETKE